MSEQTIPDTVYLSGPVVELAASEGDKPRTFDMAAYNGGLVPSWGDPLVVDVEGMSMPKRDMPILREHKRDRIVGYGRPARDGGTIRCSGTVSKTTEDGREVAGLSDEGFPWQASIGFRVLRASRSEDGDTREVNGQTFSGPLMVIEKSELLEASFVALGRDSTTSAVVMGAPECGQIQLSAYQPPREEVEMGKQEDREETTPRGVSFSDRVKKFQVAFADRPEFAMEQLAAGATLLEAKAALADIQTAELAEQRKRLEQLESLKTTPGTVQAVTFAGGERETLGQEKPKQEGMTVTEFRARLNGIGDIRGEDRQLSAASKLAKEAWKHDAEAINGRPVQDCFLEEEDFEAYLRCEAIGRVRIKEEVTY